MGPTVLTSQIPWEGRPSFECSCYYLSY